MLQDIRYALRILFKSPGFTAVAVLSLALGIGANTSLFSVINTVLWSPLPYEDADRLMMVQRTEAKTGTASLWSYPKFEAMRNNSEVFEQVAAYRDQNFPLTETDNPERLRVEMVSASYFPLLGVEAALGRAFAPEEDRTPGSHPVALLGHGLWQRRYGADPNILGQTISLNKVSLTIVGVLPEGFKGVSGAADAWVPIMMAPALTGIQRRLVQPFAHWHSAVGRLREGVTLEQARAEMEVVGPKIEEALPKTAGTAPPASEQVRVVSMKEAGIDPAIRKSFLILFAAVGLVLLIACANIANLLLARSASRRKEIAIRLALGAGRRRLIRQLLTESVLLSLLGGVAALLVAMWGIEFLSAIKPAALPDWASRNQQVDFSGARLDSQVLAFNLLLSILTGALFGLVPAIQASRHDVNDALKEGALVSVDKSHRRRRFSLRNILVVAEIALSIVLLVGAGLMIKSLWRLQAIPIGFDHENLLTFQVHLPKYTQEAAARFYERLLGYVGELPGVESASVASSTPLSSNSSATNMKIEGVESEGLVVGVHSVGTEHFNTLRIPLLKGRPFTETDREGAKLVAIVSETAARRFWPDEDPIGKRIWLGIGWKPDQFGEIVGIVGDVKYGRVEQEARPDVYLSYLQPTEPSSFVIVRTTTDPALLVEAVRQQVLAIDKNVPLYDVKTMDERSAEATSRTRFSALLLAIFAALALVLATVGVYGVMSYAVSGRTREIGLRMALGARPRDVLGMVLGDGMVLTLAGLVLGLAGAYAAARALASQLYEVGATDPATFVVVSALFLVIAMVATYIPARRATKVDPMVALRYE